MMTGRLFPWILTAALAVPCLAGQEGCPGADADNDGWTTEAGDCNDADASIHPGAPEVCDGLDNDCDTRIDDIAECYAGQPPEIILDTGPVRGVAADEGTFAYLGVPFATPPVGDLRWRPPVDHAPWTEVLEADTFGAACPQYVSRDEDGDGVNDMVFVGDEDCLFLNVWHPQTSSDHLRPIMVWIHGGGNVIGSEDTPLYDGARLAAEADAVVVTIQYRLSFLGWFNHRAFQEGDPLADSGNFGLMDIQQALKWVQRNGQAFGGDPARVTLFGESAGGWNTWAGILSPISRGLFHRAIIESGCPDYLTVAEARALAQSLTEWAVIADGLATPDNVSQFLAAQGEEWVRDYLYSKSAEELMQVAFDNGGIDLAEYGPIQDGFVMPENALASLDAGDYNRVPILMGANRDEMKIFLFPYADMTDEEFQILMDEWYGDYADDLEALYPREAYTPATPYNQFADIADGYLELLCTEYVATLVASHQDTFLYHFTYDDLAPPMDYMLGAAHSLELPFVFGNMTDSLYAEGTEQDRYKLMTTIMDYWSCFAATGNPSGCREPVQWPTFVTEEPGAMARMVLDTETYVEQIPAIDEDRWTVWLEMSGMAGLP